MIREITPGDLSGLLELYTHLHEISVPEDSEHLRSTWSAISEHPDYHIIVCEEDGRIVSSCVCVIVPNLTGKRIRNRLSGLRKEIGSIRQLLQDDADHRHQERKHSGFLQKCRLQQRGEDGVLSAVGRKYRFLRHI